MKTWFVVTGSVSNTGLSFEKNKVFINPNIHDNNAKISITVNITTITETGIILIK